MSTRTKNIFIIAILAFILITMNPSIQRHRIEFNEKFSQLNPIAGTFGFGAIFGKHLQYHSVVIASYTLVDGHMATIGFLNTVFIVIPDKDLDIK